MRKIIILTLIGFCVYSCKRIHKVEKRNYKTGELRYEKKFLYQNDTLNYTFKEYYKNEKVKDNYKVVNGKIHGRAISYYKSGNVENISDYMLGDLHGINIIFNDNKEIVRESLYLNNKQKIYLAYQKNDNNDIKKLVYIVNNGKARKIGQLVVKEAGGINCELTYYYQIFIEEDTVGLNEAVKCSIVPIIGNCNEECYIEIKMGEFDETFSFIDEREVGKLKLNNLDTLIYELRATRIGFNLIMGKMCVKSIEDSSLLGELYIYKDYFVESGNKVE